MFSSAGANRLARALVGALRDPALELADDDEVRAEFMTARIIGTGPGVVKISSPSGTHDDLVVAVWMLAVDLVQVSEVSTARISLPSGRRIERSLRTRDLRRLANASQARPGEARHLPTSDGGKSVHGPDEDPRVAGALGRPRRR